MVHVHASRRWVMGCHHVSNREQRFDSIWRLSPARKPPLVPNLAVDDSVDENSYNNLYLEPEDRQIFRQIVTRGICDRVVTLPGVGVQSSRHSPGGILKYMHATGGRLVSLESC
jgi:hypothetical protein